MMARLAIALLLALAGGTATAANYPCSGSKGGVSHCEGATWVCNDGTASGSKRNCSAERGNRNAPPPATGTSVASECPCSGSTLCTGPRGGKYCVTAGGNKSYK